MESEYIQHSLSSKSLSEFQGNVMGSATKPVMEGEDVATGTVNIDEIHLRSVLTPPNKLGTDRTSINRQSKDNSDVSYV